MRVEWGDALDWKVALDGAAHHQELNEAGVLLTTANPKGPNSIFQFSKSTRTERRAWSQ